MTQVDQYASEAASVRELMLEKIKIMSAERIPRQLVENSQLELTEDFFAEGFVARFSSYILGLLDEVREIHYRYPEDWWQAFKDRWFPKWALKRWPARFVERHHTIRVFKAVCPHLDTARPGEHISWFMQQ